MSINFFITITTYRTLGASGTSYALGILGFPNREVPINLTR